MIPDPPKPINDNATGQGGVGEATKQTEQQSNCSTARPVNQEKSGAQMYFDHLKRQTQRDLKKSAKRLQEKIRTKKDVDQLKRQTRRNLEKSAKLVADIERLNIKLGIKPPDVRREGAEDE